MFEPTMAAWNNGGALLLLIVVLGLVMTIILDIYERKDR